MDDNSPVTLDYLKEDIPLARLIELRNKGLTHREIGAIVGCSKQNVQERLAPYLPQVQHLPAIKEHRADLLTVMGAHLLDSLTPGDIQKASAYQRVGMAGLLHNMERLERGQTTSNVGMADYTERLSDIMKRRDQLRAELGMEPDESEVVDV